jgi:hypothetical protein
MSHPFLLIRHHARATALIAGVVLVLAAGMSAPAAAQDKEAIKIELPQPYFGGTPLDYFGPNLEKPNYKPRPPFMAPKGTTNVALGKAVSSSDADPEFGALDLLVDGDKGYRPKRVLGLANGHQWVQVDLGAPHHLYAFLLWHYHAEERVYFDMAVQVASDAEFTKDVQFVFNNDHDNSAGLGVGSDKEYVEDYRGKLVDMKGVKGQFVRLYTMGNTSDELNHYVELEVFGKPAE